MIYLLGVRHLKRLKISFYPPLIGSVVGFGIGIAFVIYWFGIHAGIFHTMAIVHEIAGIIVGLLIGLIISFLNR